MAFIEQLLFGYNHHDETGGRQELAHSAGMGADVATEIHGLCEGWGQPPELGLPHPVLMSHALQATMPSMRGKLFAVICVVPADVPLFHALVISDSTYVQFGRNPFALANAVTFCSEWLGGSSLDRIEIETENQAPLVHPAPNADDVGLVDEAVMQFITTGQLHLPLELPVRASDRALALIIACLPEMARKELQFTSFTTTTGKSYAMAGIEAEGTAYAGWQRLMMARLDSAATESQKQYKDKVGDLLKNADLVGISRLSNRHEFVTNAVVPIVFSPASTPASGGSGDANMSPRSFRLATEPIAPSSGAIDARSPVRRLIKRSPGIRPMTAAGASPIGGGFATRTTMPDHGLDPAAAPVSAQRSSRSQVRARLTSPVRRGRRGESSRFMRVFSVLLVTGLAAWVGTMWLEGKTLSESLDWAGLPGMDGGRYSKNHTGTLLEVVDVGHVYQRALKHTGGKGFGLTASRDIGRNKALGRLQSDATTPLLEQVALFTSLGSEGIQQGSRPDREVKRLNALAQQGLVLKQEMDRLELAWYSLTTGVNWRDVASLSDTEVDARWDSLMTTEKGALADVRLGMGTKVVRQELRDSRRHVNGMAEVVRLFQVRHWSTDWEKSMERAAARIVPTASRITRAYRNSAFALVRLKRAERSQPHRELPYVGHFQESDWPSPDVKALLLRLRKESGRFSDRNAPRLLGATLAIYTALEAPEKTMSKITASAKDWEKLQNNAAVRFDPELYTDFLQRLKFEAAQKVMAGNGDERIVPSHLYSGELAMSSRAFADSLATLTSAAQWQAMSEVAIDPYLGRWSARLATNMEARLAYLQNAFEAAWNDCRTQTAALQSQVLAGEDWSAGWRRLDRLARETRDRFAGTLGEDGRQNLRFAYLDRLIANLEEARPLSITRVTVRLAQDILDSSREVQLALRTPVGGRVWTSKPFVIGPSAPAGTGWVGTAFLDWSVEFAPTQGMTASLVLAEVQQELLLVNYDSVADGGGPASLAKVRAGETGSISFRVNCEDYWRELDILALGLIF